MASADGHVLGQGDVLGGHDAAGAVLRVAQQLLDLFRLVPLHVLEDLVAGVLVEVRHQVGGVVRAHLLEDVGGARGMEVLHHIDLRLGLHLLHGVRHGLVVEGGEHAGAVGRGELVEDVGKVRRMELGESLVGHPQLDRRDGRLDRIDVLPVDVPLRQGPAEGPDDRPERAFEAQPARQARGPDIDRDEVQATLDVVEPKVVDADHLAPVDVHDLAVEQVLAQQDLIGPLLEDPDVDRPGVQHDAGLVERPDRRPGQEDAPACGIDDQTGDRRVAVTDGDDEVVHLADGLALPIVEQVAPRRCPGSASTHLEAMARSRRGRGRASCGPCQGGWLGSCAARCRVPVGLLAGADTLRSWPGSSGTRSSRLTRVYLPPPYQRACRASWRDPERSPGEIDARHSDA